MALLRAGVFYSLYTSLLARVVDTTGFDLWPSRAIALVLVALLWFLPWHLLLIPWIKGAKRQVETLIIFAALAMTAMGVLTRDIYFSRADGRPQKYYIQTLDGYKFSATPGTDPVYGIPYKPVTPEFAHAYILWRHRGGNIQDPTLPEGRYFDPATGDPLRWYTKLPNGKIDMFTLPGFHPTYGLRLAPATAESVAEYEKQKAETELHQKRRAEQESERQARQDAWGKAKAEQERKARERALSKTLLRSGRYLFTKSPQSATLDGLIFTLAEIDVTAYQMLMHVDIENEGNNTGISPRAVRFGLLTADGIPIAIQAFRRKVAPPNAANGTLTVAEHPSRGAFVLVFPRRADYLKTFSLVVDDQPLFSGVNLHRAKFVSF
jgi:hypothetical protein